jgi:hypothetical protein
MFGNTLNTIGGSSYTVFEDAGLWIVKQHLWLPGPLSLKFEEVIWDGNETWEATLEAAN